MNITFSIFSGVMCMHGFLVAFFLVVTCWASVDGSLHAFAAAPTTIFFPLVLSRLYLRMGGDCYIALLYIGRVVDGGVLDRTS